MVWILVVRMWIMHGVKCKVTYRLEIPQCDYLAIVELEEEGLLRPELKEEL